MTTYNVIERLAELFREADSPDVPLAPEPTAAPGLPRIGDVGPEDLPMDWRVAWEERAAIKEYDGHLPRQQAEAEALAEVIGQMDQEGKSSGCA